MLSIKRVIKSRKGFFSPILLLKNALHSPSTSTSSVSSRAVLSYATNSQIQPFIFFCARCCCYHSAARGIQATDTSIRAKDVALSFKQWFESRNSVFFDRIFEILSGCEVVDELALSQLDVPHHLSEKFVLEVLSYGSVVKKDILSCLKFFDWAGRQHAFSLTRSAFLAIFKILSKAKHMPLMLNYLDNFIAQRFRHLHHKFGFYAIVVMGYAVAGKPHIALQLFGRMRFQGLDLDAFVYHVLLNALVEESCFDAVEIIAKQIALRGFETDVTHSIMVKSFCKQKLLDEAEAYLRGLRLSDGRCPGHALGFLVGALCQNGKFDKAEELLEEFRELWWVHMEPAYGVWLRDLVRAGKLDRALEFLKSKKSLEGYVPEVFRFNILLCRLLKEDHLQEAFDMLMEMKEAQISPDEVTMNAALCFFCKAGMVDVAFDLYNSKSEFGFSPNSMAYNYLINSLCGDGSIDEAYHVLKNSNQEYFPRKKTFSILANALCREGKLDKMEELVIVAQKRKFMSSDCIYDKYISALCMAGRPEDGYLILDRMNRVAERTTYSNLIHGFNKSNRGDIAARLLIDMQDKGYTATETLFRGVIGCLCNMKGAEVQVLKLLEMQLSRHEPNFHLYNLFIREAGHAKKPELAREMFEMILRSGIEPSLSSDILMLQSYLKSDKISDVLNFFNKLRQERKAGKKLYNTMVVGLSKVNRAGLALEFLREMRSNGVVPSVECYEVLVKLLCSCKQYDVALNLVKDLEEVGRRVTTFVGNILLLHALRRDGLYEAWVRQRNADSEISSNLSILGLLIGAFYGCITVDQEVGYLEEVIEQCFPLDIFTCNLLLRRLCMRNMDHACEFFNKICQKGHEPNRWTYDVLIHGLIKHGRKAEAERCLEEMDRKGFDHTRYTKRFI